MLIFYDFADRAVFAGRTVFADSADFADYANFTDLADFADSADSPSYHPPQHLLTVSYLKSSKCQRMTNDEFGQICPYGHIWTYVKKYGQVRYPQKKHQKCNSETLTTGPSDTPVKSYGKQLFFEKL